MEVLNGLTKTTLGDDGEDFLELTEGGTSIAGALGVSSLILILSGMKRQTRQ